MDYFCNTTEEMDSQNARHSDARSMSAKVILLIELEAQCACNFKEKRGRFHRSDLNQDNIGPSVDQNLSLVLWIAPALCCLTLLRRPDTREIVTRCLSTEWVLI
jgi:hypothetical protein